MDPATEQRIVHLPTLDDIAADPGCVGGLPPRALAALQSQMAVVQAAIAAEALAATETPQVQGSRAGDDLRLLDASEVAELLGTSKAVVYEMARRKKIGSVCASMRRANPGCGLRGLTSKLSFLPARARSLAPHRAGQRNAPTQLP